MKHTRESWAALRSSEDRRRVVMPGCGISAVAKSRGDNDRRDRAG
jgi:hypothetical protein